MFSWSSVRRSLTVLLVAGLLAAGLWATDRGGRDEAASAAPRPAVPAEVTETPVPAVEEEDVEERPAAALRKEATEVFTLLGVTWDPGSTDEEPRVEVRWRSLAEGWSDWTTLENGTEVAAGDGVRPGTDPLWVGESDGVDVRVSTPSGKAPTGVRVATVTDGRNGDMVPTAGTVGQPKIISRSAWGASGGSTCSSPVYGASTLGTTLHHTAGSNSYSKSQSAGIVRSTQAYHTKSQKWCDIGYNFLVDKYGQIFEGRKGGITKQVRGAHAGVNAMNERTVGVSMMGNYDTAGLPSAMKNAVADLIAWRHSLADIPAIGTYSLGGKRYNRILGHRDVKSTACPGRHGYTWLNQRGGLRDAVASRLAAGPAVVSGIGKADVDTTAATVRWSKVAGATRYRVYVSTDPSMPSKCEPNCDVVTPANLDAPSHRLTGLAGGTPYYVKISAIDSSGRTITGWQDTPYRITTDVIGIAAKAAGATALDVSWKAVPGAAKYRVYHSTSSSMPSSCEPNCSVVTPKDLTSPSHRLSGLKGGTTYHLKVSAIDSSGKTMSDWQTDPVRAATTSSPTTVQAVAGKAVSATSMDVSWEAYPGAVKYRIYHSPTSSMPSSCEPNCTVVTPKDLDSPSHRLAGLKAGGTYYLKISAIGSNGKTISSWQASPVSVKLPAAAAPTTVQAVAGKAVSATSMDVSWGAYPGAVKYRIYHSPSSSMPSSCEPNCTVVTPKDLDSPSHRLTGLKAGGTYYLKISAIGSNGKTISSWQASPVSVKLPAPAVPSTVQGVSGTAVSATSLDMSWDAVTGAAKYRVYYSTSSSMPSSCEPNCKVVTPSDLASPSYRLTGLKSGATYHLKVSAINAAGKTMTGWQSSPATVKLPAGTSVRNSITVPSSRSIAVKGHGYGHGIGMSQYGAEGGARSGASYTKILSTYYPGTTLGSRTGSIRVLLTGATWDSLTVTNTSGLRFRQPIGGSTITLPTSFSGRNVERWTIEPQAADKRKSVLRYRTSAGWTTYRTWTGEAQFESSSPLKLVTASGTKTYRTSLRSVLPTATTRDVVNVLSIEDYTRGVVAREMPSSWHSEALKAQSVAARTYGVRSIRTSGRYDICDTTSCQVYGGVAAETAATDAAIKATAGKVLMHSGTPAFTQFSSSSGGFTNKGSQPYLKAVADPWDDWSGNANHAWTKNVSAATIEKAYPAIGKLSSLSITKRNGNGDMGGRVTSITLKGSKASKTISGVDARWSFGLKSDWFGF